MTTDLLNKARDRRKGANYSLPQSIRAELEELAMIEGVSKSTFAEHIIRVGLNEYKKGKRKRKKVREMR